jgi:ABC-type branched-subunit amino acid transport system ATPase component
MTLPGDQPPRTASLAAAILDEEASRVGARSRPAAFTVAAPPSHDALLELRQIDFSYGKVQVLFGIDLAVRRGDTVALLGANGAGKSTLLRVISGLEAPHHGVVRFDGVDITGASAERRARFGIVQLTGGCATFPPLSVADNLRAGAFRYGRADAQSRIARALDVFPVLGERLKAAAGDLSGGQQHILALALALMHDPEILIIDEMSLGLAPLVVQQVVEVVRGLSEGGATMIIVEQSLNVALSIADRVVVMEKGEIRVDGTATELAAHGDLVRSVVLGT